MSRKNIEPGVLCYLTGTECGNDGKIVEVLRLAPDYSLIDGDQRYWWVMGMSPLTFVYVIGDVGGIPVTTTREEMGGEVVVGERYLRPINDPDMETEDERATDRPEVLQ
jgi:hypothetical protein